MQNEPAVLTYHAIGSAPRGAPLYSAFVSPAAFEAQMAFLARRRRVVPLELAVAGEGGVAITFDDAYEGLLTEAVPVLRRLGLPATVFVPTAWIGDRNRWDAGAPASLRIMTGEQLVELAAAGLEIASHGHAHIDLGRADPVAVRADVDTSARILEDLLGRRPRFFAYPFGASSPDARAAVAAAGFQAGFGLGKGHGRMALERTTVHPGDRRWIFALKSSPRYVPWRRSRPARGADALAGRLLRRRRRWGA
ncbi:MAG: polysaccharide deacetylase family protein [Solirubrobacterales bacterium]